MQMHKYLIQVPLRYIKRPFCDENPEVVRKIRWEVVNPFNTTMKYIYNGNVKKVNVEVIGDSKNGIRICTDELLGSSKDDALKIVRKIAKKICINLSFSAQKQLDNFEEFHSYFYWEDRQIHINEVDTKVTCKRTVSEDKHNVTLAVNEPILSNCSRFREQVDMELTRSINLLGLNNLELCVEKNPACKFMLAAFYAALGNRDISSQYFNLFTIIEYLEQNEMKEYPECRQGLLSEKSKKDLLKNITACLKGNDSIQSAEKNRIISRLNSIIEQSTYMSRAEKLQFLLREKYYITGVNLAGKNISFDNLEELKSFINMRNHLFHSSGKKESYQRELLRLNNELFLLCQNIISKEIEAAS